MLGIGGGYCPIGCTGGLQQNKLAFIFTNLKSVLELTADSDAKEAAEQNFESAADLVAVRHRFVVAPAADAVVYRRYCMADWVAQALVE